ncbi:nuclease-related domain-containing protein [Sporosarcina sp. FSL K6-1522]|uniref:nuclease-related domain-containing protein n=1 Tax=Sporosarcina sp. FSL K6-1522 TaxID=2921554 RepID=UPI00315B19A6
MIYKQRSMPKKLIGLAALLQRLDPTQELYRKVEEDFRNLKAGFGGEQNSDKHLLEFKPLYPHAILHDVCLKHDGVYFQMDSILITPAFILIIEVKNIGGKLIFKSNPDRFVRQNDSGGKKAMKSPVAEVERKKFFLQQWLTQTEIHVPVKGVVALAYSNELELEIDPSIPILFTYQLPNYLYSLSVEQNQLNAAEIQKVTRKMIKDHKEYNPFPMMVSMEISRTAILSGVICPACNNRGMQWMKRRWRCRKCDYFGGDCHLRAIADWHYLISDKITNREFRGFVCLKDRNVARRLLAKPDFEMKGNRRNAFYKMRIKSESVSK